MFIKSARLCNQGGRDKNDDTVLISKKLFKVCAFVGDGLGAYEGGKEASAVAAQVVHAQWQYLSLLNDVNMRETAEKANCAVMNLQKQKHGNMKTTLVALCIEGKSARWMHIGDSRLYHFRNGKLVTQTMDHSVSQVAALMGDITPDQIRFHEDRNKVLRALGGENARPDISPVVPVRHKEDVFLLCTDGFWEYVYEKEMEELLSKVKTPEQWLAEMEKILLSRVTGENDNYTAAAIFC